MTRVEADRATPTRARRKRRGASALARTRFEVRVGGAEARSSRLVSECDVYANALSSNAAKIVPPGLSSRASRTPSRASRVPRKGSFSFFLFVQRRATTRSSSVPASPRAFVLTSGDARRRARARCRSFRSACITRWLALRPFHAPAVALVSPAPRVRPESDPGGRPRPPSLASPPLAGRVSLRAQLADPPRARGVRGGRTQDAVRHALLPEAARA
jgi:hypothetical protein